jgi:hypothetical protein
MTTEKILANPRNFDSIVAMFTKLTGRTPTDAELAAARKKFGAVLAGQVPKQR